MLIKHKVALFVLLFTCQLEAFCCYFTAKVDGEFHWHSRLWALHFALARLLICKLLIARTNENTHTSFVFARSEQKAKRTKLPTYVLCVCVCAKVNRRAHLTHTLKSIASCVCVCAAFMSEKKKTNPFCVWANREKKEQILSFFLSLSHSNITVRILSLIARWKITRSLFIPIPLLLLLLLAERTNKTYANEFIIFLPFYLFTFYSSFHLIFLSTGRKKPLLATRCLRNSMRI